MTLSEWFSRSVNGPAKLISLHSVGLGSAGLELRQSQNPRVGRCVGSWLGGWVCCEWFMDSW